MNTKFQKLVFATFILAGLFSSCKKYETVGSADEAEMTVDSAAVVSDSISMAATQEVEGKRFIKNADVEMEVKDVYDATITIEKNLKEIGGFVTNSKMNALISSEETFPISDNEAKLVKKFRQVNTMEVRVPTVKLGEFLDFVNNSNLFLHTRNISAEDVSSNILMAKLEEKRMQKTEKNIEKIKNNSEKVSLADGNLQEQNIQKLETFNLNDNLKYSTVTLNLSEPSDRISTIAIANTKNIDNQYRYNFFYDVKNAIVEGFYLVQQLIVALFTIWPFILIAGLVFYFWRKRKQNLEITKTEQNS
jgi:hypothetical protein